MQVCTSLQTDNHASTPPLSFFTGRMPFLPPNQQCQSTEGTLKTSVFVRLKCHIAARWPIEFHLSVVSHLKLSIFIHQVWVTTAWVTRCGLISTVAWCQQSPQSRTLVLPMFQLVSHRLKVLCQQSTKTNVYLQKQYIPPRQQHSKSWELYK